MSRLVLLVSLTLGSFAHAGGGKIPIISIKINISNLAGILQILLGGGFPNGGGNGGGGQIIYPGQLQQPIIINGPVIVNNGGGNGGGAPVPPGGGSVPGSDPNFPPSVDPNYPPSIDPNSGGSIPVANDPNGGALSIPPPDQNFPDPVANGGDPNSSNPIPIDPNDDGGWINTSIDHASMNAANRSLTKHSYFVEPKQNAVLAWNGNVEILNLIEQQSSTVGSHFMLSMIPLPGEPLRIKKGDAAMFDRAKALAPALQAQRAAMMNVHGKPATTEVIHPVQIGPHTVFAVRANQMQGFAAAIAQRVSELTQGQGQPLIDTHTQQILENYFSRHFEYFAIDITRTDVNLSEKIAIEYVFKSPEVYFPILIGQSGGTGNTDIELAVLTRGTISQFNKNYSLPQDQIRAGATRALGTQQLASVDPSFPQFFGGKADLRLWSIRGNVSALNRDIIGR